MLALLSFKFFNSRKKILKNDKPKINSHEKCSGKACYKNQKVKIRKTSLTEILVLLFGMFGVPISYFCYTNLVNLYYWSIFNETFNVLNTPVGDQSLYHFPEMAISIKDIIETRLKNRHKYNFNYSWTDIDRRNNLSIEEFRDMYSGKWPVIITDCATKWPAFKKWNKDFFTKHYGKELVTIKTMADGVSETFGMPFEIFLRHLHEGYPHQWTYLNDEMFIPSRPQLQRDLGSCKEISEDFFEMFPIEVRPWWSFLLWGTRFSRSQLHMDPFNWTGTNMVISGLKHWKLFPPGQDKLLHVISEEKYKFPIHCFKYNSDIDCFNPKVNYKYPSLQYAKVLEFYQYPGELLIIPTGWFHQAFNEEVTLAVSGQIMNTENYLNVLEELFKGGDFPRDGYNSSTRVASPKEQVRTVLSKVTEKMKNEGREATKFIYEQMRKLAESSGSPIPPSILDRTET